MPTLGSGALIGLVEATKLGTMSGSIKSCHLCIGSITHDNEVTEDDSTSLQHKDLIFTAERGICQQFLAYGQYFTVPHLFLQDSCRNPVIPVEFQWNPAGIHSFQWNSSGILQESTHSSGIPVESCRDPLIPVEFQWNPQESTGILLEFHWNKTGI